MQKAQLYCTINDLVQDLQIGGDEPKLMQHILSASQYIERHIGQFIPILDSRIFASRCRGQELNTGALLSTSAVTVDSIAVTDYTTEPSERCWLNGPYTSLMREARWGELAQVSGNWGYYEEIEEIGADVTQLLADKTLTVSNGSLVSPGMILLIEDEQELVTAGAGGTMSPVADAAISLLNGAIDNATETVTVDNGAEFHIGEVVQIDTEDFYIRKIGGNSLICGRGWNGTTQAAHTDDSAISVYRTFAVTRAVNGTIAAAHTDADLRRFLPPPDVNWLCRQIAGLMRQKAMTAFAGRAGNADTGETFYINEFPRVVIEAVKSNYVIPYL
jgi:hypothetical protein